MGNGRKGVFFPPMRLPLESKKFLITAVSVICLFVMAMWGDGEIFRGEALLIFGFVVVGYLGGQTYLDRYLQMVPMMVGHVGKEDSEDGGKDGEKGSVLVEDSGGNE